MSAKNVKDIFTEDGRLYRYCEFARTRISRPSFEEDRMSSTRSTRRRKWVTDRDPRWQDARELVFSLRRSPWLHSMRVRLFSLGVHRVAVIDVVRTRSAPLRKNHRRLCHHLRIAAESLKNYLKDPSRGQWRHQMRIRPYNYASGVFPTPWAIKRVSHVSRERTPVPDRLKRSMIFTLVHL